MSFVGQILRNRFPLWSTIRKDDSSVGAIVFDAIGRVFESSRFVLFRQLKQIEALSNKRIYEPANFYLAELETSQGFLNYRLDNPELFAIQIIADNEGEEVPLVEAQSYDELCRVFPSRFDLIKQDNEEDYLVAVVEDKRFDETVYNLHKNPSKLFINIEASTNYFSDATVENFYERRFVTLRGRDNFYRKIEEEIPLSNDGIFETRNIFKRLEPLERDVERNISGGPSIECYGFDGVVEILREPVKIKRRSQEDLLLVKKTDEFNFNESLIDSVLRAEVEYDEVENATYLSFYNYVYEAGEKYILKDTEVEPSTFEQLFLKQQLLTTNLDDIVVEDFCFDEVRNKIVTIDNAGILRWFNIEPTPFRIQNFPRTKQISIGIDCEKQRFVKGETARLHFTLDNAISDIHKVLIGRQKPSDTEIEDETSFQMQWLQDDLTWGQSFHFFSGRDDVDLYSRFNNLSAETVLDEYGQHDFYVFTFASIYNQYIDYDNVEDGLTSEDAFKKSILKHIKEPNQSEIFIDRYSLMCETSEEIFVVETEVLTKASVAAMNQQDLFLSIWFDGVSSDLYILASDNTDTCRYKVDFKYDYYLFDYTSGIAGLLENYTSLNLLINNEYEEVIDGYAE